MSEHGGISLEEKGPVLVIGSSGVDIICRVAGEVSQGTSNPSQIRIEYGGVGRNVAENLVRLGQPVTLISAVGSDERGDALLAYAQEAGVDTSHVMRSPDYPTGTYLAIVNQRGELQYAMDDMRACSAITPAYLKLNQHLFEEASLIYVDANLSKDALRAVFHLARRAGTPVAADPTSDSLAVRFLPYLHELYMVSPNLSEAGILSERPLEAGKRRLVSEAARTLIGKGVRLVILTLAHQGVYYATSDTAGFVPAVKTEIIDPTGAGDALSATVVFALLNDIPLDDAIRLGVTAASLTLRHPGAVYPELSLEKLYERLVI